MNFTQKRNVIKRTTLESLKGNSNNHYTVSNKKTSILFSFNPTTKIGVLSAEITPPVELLSAKDPVVKLPPALRIVESKVLESLETLLRQMKDISSVQVTEQLVKDVINIYLKTVQEPYSVINSKKFKHIIEKYLKKTKKKTVSVPEYKPVQTNVVIDEKRIADIVKNIHEKKDADILKRVNESINNAKREIQENKEANVLKKVNELINNAKRDIQKEVVSIVQKIPKYDDKGLKTEFTNFKQQQQNSLNLQIAKLQKGTDELKKEFETKMSSVQQHVQQIKQEILDKCTDIVHKHTPKVDVLSTDDVERTVKLHWETLLSKTEEDEKSIFEMQIEKIVERVLNEQMEKDEVMSQNGSISSQSVQYENIYEPEKDVEFCAEDIDLGMNITKLEIKPREKLAGNPLQKNIMDQRRNPNKPAEMGNMGDVYNYSESGGASGGFSYQTNALRNLTDKRWVPFGKGVSDTVMDMYVDPVTQKLYITGLFQCVDEVPAKNVASYDIQQKEWSNVGNGINNLGVCLCMDIENQILYIGGLFSQAGGVESDSKVTSCDGITANNIVSYNLLTNEWESLGEGLNSECCVLCYNPVNKKLYAGGTFTKIGDKDIPYVGVYNTVNKEWSALSEHELNGPCRSMVLDEEVQELFLGGIFNEVGEYIIYYVASVNLDSGEWSELSGGLQGHCNCLCLHPNRKILYVGGTFQSVGYIENRIDAHHVAAFDLESREWSSMSGGVNGVCQTMMYSRQDNCLYVGGSFKKVISENYYNDLKGAAVVNHIVKYDTVKKEWIHLDNLFDTKNDKENKIGLDGPCKTMAMDDKSIYLGGNFKEAGTVHAKSIVRYMNVRMKR